MKSIVIFCFVLVQWLLTSGIALAEDPMTKTLVVGSEQDYPPFALGLTDATADGFTVELWKAVAKEAGLKYTIRVRPFHQILQEFKEGKIDILINLEQSDERRQFVDFSIPHVIVSGAIFVRKGQTDIHSEADFAGKSIIVLNADLAHDYALSRNWKNQLVLVDTAADGFRLLSSGKYDALLISKLAGMKTLRELNITNIKVLDAKPGFSQKFSFAVHKGNTELLAKINEGLALTKPSGIFDRLYDKWFSPYEEKKVTFKDVLRYLAPILLILFGLAIYAFYKRHVERERLLMQMEDRTEQLNAIFTLSPDGFVTFDKGSRVKYANPAFFRMTMLIKSDIVGLSLDDFLARLMRQCLKQTPFPDIGSLKILQRDGGSVAEKSRQLIKMQGPDNRVLEIGIRTSDASTVSQILYFRDVTYETEVDRMKSEFLSHAAHELRTPMASILGFSELLLEMELDEPTQRDLLDTIHRQSLWLVNIINELLDLARIEARGGQDLTITHVDLTALTRDTVANMAVADDRWKITLDLPSEAVYAQADIAKLRQALNNIIGNAIKYSPEGGEIRIIVVSAAGKAKITVSDQGIGMTPAQIPHYGERFWRADTSGNIPGTGLGVAIVKEIIEIHGGRVEIESVSGTGTAVTILLPEHVPDQVSTPSFPRAA